MSGLKGNQSGIDLAVGQIESVHRLLRQAKRVREAGINNKLDSYLGGILQPERYWQQRMAVLNTPRNHRVVRSIKPPNTAATS